MPSVDLNLLRLCLVIIFLSISVILNGFGFYCLRRTKHKLKTSTAKQHQILSCLSVSELCYSFLALGKWILNYNGLNQANSVIYRVFYAGVFSSFYVYCCLLLVLLTNRFLLVACPFKHFQILSRQRVCYAVVVSWVLSFSLAIPLAYIQVKFWSRYISVGYVVVEVLVLAHTIITFSYIGYMVRGHRNNVEQTSQSSHTRVQHGDTESVREDGNSKRCKSGSVPRRKLRHLTVALLTLFSFVPLTVIPDVVVMILLQYGSISDTAIDFIYSMLNLNFVADPLVYMLTYPLVYRQIKKTLQNVSMPSMPSSTVDYPKLPDLSSKATQLTMNGEHLPKDVRL